MSWFNNLSESISEKLTSTDITKSISEKLTSTNITKTLEALTLQSPELTSELNQIDSEERRKELVHNALSGLLPWETRTEEGAIFQEECKEEMLKLSLMNGTFMEKVETPLEMPALLKDFDLDAHVGLIERLFSVDKNLVEMHSQLSGPGQAEIKFWQNYFQNCAVARHRAGLSLDEIWIQPTLLPTAAATTNLQPDVTSGTKESVVSSQQPQEETVNLESSKTTAVASVKSAVSSSLSFASNMMKPVSTPLTPVKTIAKENSVNVVSSAPSAKSPVSLGQEFEVISKEDGTGSDEDETGEDLDDLAAEIARELENL